uniref:RNA-dependent RNA polymerase n=1 Tax=Korotkevich virus TaxID=2707230 RepID=A0A6H0DHE2_9VIRU|nr:MAG: RNA-dependent RNA polymerase [Korotkevich virus]
MNNILYMENIILSPESLDEQLTPLAQTQAAAGFQMLREGKAPTSRTPLYKGNTEEEVVNNWLDVLTRYEEDEVLRPLISYDKTRMSKVGPQGGYPPFSEREADFNEYFTRPDQSDFEIDYDICLEIYEEVFGGATDKRPLSPQNVIDRDQYDDKLQTNSGAPDYGKRKDPMILAKALADSVSGKWKSYAMILGSRSQRGKARFIFMAPFSLNIIEKTFLYPLMEIIRSRQIDFFAAWEGFTEVELGFQRQNFFDGDIFVQQDYTAMDKSLNNTTIEIFLAIVLPVFQKQHQESLKDLVYHIFDIPIMTSLGKMVVGRHGMPSGSGFTNFFESIISYYVWKLNVKNSLRIAKAQGLGDDLAFSIQAWAELRADKEMYEIWIETMIDTIVPDVISDTSASIGLTVQPEKQLVDRYTTIYLQRFFDIRIPNTDGLVLGMYPSILALNTAMNPERFHDPRKWSSKMEILRWIMILENCKNLPYFEDLVHFFIEGDKFKMGLEIPDFFITLPSIYEDSKLIKGFLPTYNQEGLDRGINDFATVKYLKKLASQA